ncbi:unnamed protein product [Rhizoctonia solani]|uniref:Uncharacterized protein n=1 Tax=Rhizoctonia solani TaxID=456999 RepID=A0A8H3E6L6_9AGAM|nr:unnamed protein product [Rhizoctonia solani]CAE7156600.1 unnamed protein product [Rhizoctonia solani]
MGVREQLDSSATLLYSHSTGSFSSKNLTAAMADFFTSSAVAAVAAKRVQEDEIAPDTPNDKAESTTTVKGAGSNFSMCEIIM